ncbi:MAG: cytochrome P450 [Chloroflexi bacterium]|nr:cytochrome P450 [Chloroflexota bacterium]
MTYPPGPQGLPLLGVMPGWLRSRLDFVLAVHDGYGDMASFSLAGRRIVQINHPDLIHEVLVKKGRCFRKADFDVSVFRLTLGDGLLSANGDYHRQQRQLVQPALHAKQIEAYARLIVEETRAMVGGWGRSVEIREAMTELALVIVARALFKTEVPAGAVARAAEVFSHAGNQMYRYLIAPPRWMAVGALRRSLNEVDALVYAMIEARRDDPGEDLMSFLMGTGMSDEEVRNEALTLLLAGHETTANALAWAWHLLGQHPAIRDALHAEVDAVLGGEPAHTAARGSLPLLDQVIKEVLRLYPPAWSLNGRVPLEPVAIGGHTLHPGDTVVIVPYVVHHDARFYPDAWAFRPGRWTPAFEKDLPRYAYFPFGGGDRYCVGASFAMMEMRLILATMLQHVRLEALPGEPPQPEPLITLRPSAPIRMKALTT